MIANENLIGLDSVKSLITKEVGVRRTPVPHLANVKTAMRYFEELGNEILKNKGQRFSLGNIDNTVEKMIKWAYLQDCGLDFKKGILLKGKTGRGKTMLMRVFHYFLQIDELQYSENGLTKPFKLEIANVKQISGEYQDSETGGYSVIQRYANKVCLVLDDIGKEQDISSSFGNKVNVIEEIVSIREEKGLLTFGTTNIDKMSDKYDDRTVSRMYALFNVLPINHDKDFRKSN